ncbi:HAD family acid phosphatase [uncultured Endozoicomonas sp.]|uniref:HAD family acid phosphatase n=1 Tax=uncultured Endozoicomonas sp. TaxID=432652 RepID=UPI002615EDD3|nr:HAD family acid phosphatase [uncultured Endozoicomonas sp.]
MLNRLSFLLILTTYVALFSAQVQSYDQKDLNNEIVIAANWQQHSAEYEAYFYQVYNIASDRLSKAISKTPAGKKPAIITDIDDTLLSNTRYFSSLVGTEDRRNTERSLSYWQQEDPKALPGAVSFLQKANDMGVDIFYISGRYHSVKNITIRHLRNLGFPVKSEEHVLLQERNNKTLSKNDNRRLVIEKGYFPIMLLGDQLSDFENTSHLALPDRNHWVLSHQTFFGDSWFIFPNVVYGQWEEKISEKYPRHAPLEIHRARKYLSQITQNTSLRVPDSYYQHIALADLWIQHSADFTANTLQTYSAASDALSAPENLSRNNKAIVVDIDGTVIQYPPIHLTPSFCYTFDTPETKVNDYLKQLNSPLVPGVKAFLDKAHHLGYEIFYLTARSNSSGKPGHQGDIALLTLAQLNANNLPNANPGNLLNRESYCPDNLLSCGKNHQRSAIRSGIINNTKYNIALFVGDYLSDFDLIEQGLSPFEKSSVEQSQHLYGRKYFLTPNPVNKTWMWQFYSKIAGKNICLLSEQERADLRVSLLLDWEGKHDYLKPNHETIDE